MADTPRMVVAMLDMDAVRDEIPRLLHAAAALLGAAAAIGNGERDLAHTLMVHGIEAIDAMPDAAQRAVRRVTDELIESEKQGKRVFLAHHPAAEPSAPRDQITCPWCNRTSTNREDVQQRFCVLCGFHEDLEQMGVPHGTIPNEAQRRTACAGPGPHPGRREG